MRYSFRRVCPTLQGESIPKVTKQDCCSTIHFVILIANLYTREFEQRKFVGEPLFIVYCVLNTRRFATNMFTIRSCRQGRPQPSEDESRIDAVGILCCIKGLVIQCGVGNTVWTGNQSNKIETAFYSPRQASFIVGHPLNARILLLCFSAGHQRRKKSGVDDPDVLNLPRWKRRMSTSGLGHTQLLDHLT